MSEQEVFEHVIASLHSAALDDAHWSATSGLIDEACGAKGNMLVFGDGDSREDAEIFFARFCYRGQRHQESEREYFSIFHAVDERLPRLRRLPDGQLVHCASLFTEEEMKTSAVYNDLGRRGDTQNSLNVRLDGPDGSRIVWVIADPVDSNGWSSARTGKIKRLLPHLRQFVCVRQALAEAEAVGRSFASLLENSRLGIVQLDRRGRIVAENGIALELLRQGDGLCDVGSFLHALSPGDDAELQRMLTRALPPFGVQGAGGSMSVKRPEGLSPLVLHVTPVADPEADSRLQRAAALVLIVDARRKAFVDPHLVAAILGLTPAESEVAVSLAEGRDVREIATATGRKESVIRWHLKQIFDKLGIARQAEVAQLVLSLANVPEARS